MKIVRNTKLVLAIKKKHKELKAEGKKETILKIIYEI
jgi:hypothetical protein